MGENEQQYNNADVLGQLRDAAAVQSLPKFYDNTISTLSYPYSVETSPDIFSKSSKWHEQDSIFSTRISRDLREIVKFLCFGISFMVAVMHAMDLSICPGMSQILNSPAPCYISVRNLCRPLIFQAAASMFSISKHLAL